MKALAEQAPGNEDYPQLSTGDVFTWLRDAGLSLPQAVRTSILVIPTEKRTKEQIAPVEDAFCPACGLDLARHPREAPGGGTSCPISSPSRLPLLDVGSWAATPLECHPDDPTRYTSEQRKPFRWSPRDVLAVTDPTLNFAIRSIVLSLKLSCFQESIREPSISGGGGLHPNSTADTPTFDWATRGRIDSPINFESESASLTASAILALSVREFARHLVQSAVTAFTNDCARVRGKPRAVITPCHVARGLVAGPFLACDGVLTGFPVARTPPVALTLSTLAQLPRKGLPPAVIDTSC